MLPKLNSAHGSETRNIINRAIELLNRLGVDVQTLVAEGQLTEDQYAKLIKEVNGLIAKGELSVHDINKNLGKLDATYFSNSFLDDLSNGTIDTTNVLPRSITQEELANSSVSEDKTTFINISTNLLNKDDVILDRVIHLESGEEIHNNGSATFIKKFDVYPGETYTIRNSYARYFYQSDGTFISSKVGNGSFTVPENVRTMRVSVSMDSLDEVKLNRGSESLPYEPYYYEVVEEMNPLKPAVIENIHLSENSVSMNNVDFIEKSSNLVNSKELLEGYSVRASNGELIANSTADTSEFIEIHPDTNYSGNMTRHSQYDAYGNFIVSHTHIAANGESFKSTPISRFVRVTYRTVERGIQQLNEGTELLPYEPYYAKLKGVEIEKDDELPKYLYDVPVEGTFNTNEIYPDYTALSIIMPAHEVYSLFDDFMDVYPDEKEKIFLGNDGVGNPINLYKFKPYKSSTTNDVKIPKIFITCGTHGHEHITPFVVLETLKQMVDKWDEYPLLEALRFNAEILVIPVVNPSGWDVWERKNHNGVDINRNMPTSQWSAGEPDSPTYGGTEPLSELESQYVKGVMDDNPDIDIMIDFHNFHGSDSTTTFLWLVTRTYEDQELSRSLIDKMTRKWRKEYDFIPSESDYFVGRSSGQYGGLIANYAEETGLPIALTYENAWRWRIDPDSNNYDNTAITTGVEAFVNWLLICLKYLSR